ncbi:MAG TPA: phosphohydrolase [Syntrophaceae bacterium]|jgi:poly(A) polymerase|nr:phosphohydrolase [Syntrophaceae bacterium]
MSEKICRSIGSEQEKSLLGNDPGDIKASRDTAISVVRRLQKAGHEAYFVGGCVRDLLRGVEPEDYDIVTSAKPDEVHRLFPHTVPVGIRFGVVIVVEEGHNYEVATFRTEHDYEDGRRPSYVEFTTAEDDVRRRDFTVNALLMDPLTGSIIDYVGGKQDIEKCLIRTIGSAEERFGEDHLRMLRAVRFAANLGYEIDPEAFEAIKVNVSAISRISVERIRDELTKLLTHGGARRGMEILAETGLLAEILPEVDVLRGVEQPPQFHPEGDVWEHILRMLDLMSLCKGLENDQRLAWGIIMHDIGKACTRTENGTGIHFYGHVREGEKIAEKLMRRLRFSRTDMETILALIHCHMLFIHVQEMRPNRLKRFLRMPDFELHLELHRLDCLGSHAFLDNYEFCTSKLAEVNADELHPPRLLNGNDLIDMGFSPGPLFSEILRAVEDAQLDGEITTSDEARVMIRNRWCK